MTSDKELVKWCEALSTQFAEETVPACWKTSKQIAELLNRSSSRTAEMLNAAIRKGRCERKLFRVQNGGTVRPVPHYKLK